MLSHQTYSFLDKSYDEWSREIEIWEGKRSRSVSYRNYPDIRVGYLPAHTSGISEEKSVSVQGRLRKMRAYEMMAMRGEEQEMLVMDSRDPSGSV
jgi:hypothetical protein